MDLQLNKKVVCITGGSEGIGLAIAKAFAKEKAHVIICARRIEKLDQAVAAIQEFKPESVEAIQTDITKTADIDELIAAISHTHGKLDILINNAGTGIYKPFAEVTDEELRHAMDMNFFAQFRTSQRALELLKKSDSPSIINISGRTAIRGNFPPGSSCSGPAKAAEVRFSIDLATELAEFGIRVNCIVPGVVKSEERFQLWEKQSIKEKLDSEGVQSIREKLETNSVPTGQKWGTPEDIANIAVFLGSNQSSYINGVALTADGGSHTKSYITQLYTK